MSSSSVDNDKEKDTPTPTHGKCAQECNAGITFTVSAEPPHDAVSGRRQLAITGRSHPNAL